MLPDELQSLLDQIDACELEAERIVADMDDDSINRPPPSGGWSVAQCLEHLALMNEFYLRGWQEAVDEAARAGSGRFKGLHPTFVGRWFAKALEPPAKLKTTAVASVQPASHFSRAETLSRYTSSHAGYRRLVRAAAALDVNRIVRPNPIVTRVKMRLATVLLVVPAHDRRHLWQAANVKRTLRGA